MRDVHIAHRLEEGNKPDMWCIPGIFFHHSPGLIAPPPLYHYLQLRLNI